MVMNATCRAASYVMPPPVTDEPESGTVIPPSAHSEAVPISYPGLSAWIRVDSHPSASARAWRSVDDSELHTLSLQRHEAAPVPDAPESHGACSVGAVGHLRAPLSAHRIMSSGRSVSLPMRAWRSVPRRRRVPASASPRRHGLS